MPPKPAEQELLPLQRLWFTVQSKALKKQLLRDTVDTIAPPSKHRPIIMGGSAAEGAGPAAEGAGPAEL
jgi:hypothetical protein